jgi:hypothetical protein
MKTVNSATLIDRLQNDTRQILVRLSHLRQVDPEILAQPPAPGKWSVAQVIEHLNSYGRYYLPQLQKALDQSDCPANATFKHGLLGNYFTQSMAPKANNRITHKMQAPKGHRPPVDIDSKTVMDEFEKQELWLLELLNRARQTDIGKLRIPITIAPFIKLKMGDVFGFLIAHHQRHFVQIDNALVMQRAGAPGFANKK